MSEKYFDGTHSNTPMYWQEFSGSGGIAGDTKVQLVLEGRNKIIRIVPLYKLKVVKRQ